MVAKNTKKPPAKGVKGAKPKDTKLTIPETLDITYDGKFINDLKKAVSSVKKITLNASKVRKITTPGVLALLILDKTKKQVLYMECQRK